jgi:hypothetical protein
MGNYEVPVPEHWLITDQDFVAFTLMNSAPNILRDENSHDGSDNCFSVSRTWHRTRWGGVLALATASEASA